MLTASAASFTKPDVGALSRRPRVKLGLFNFVSTDNPGGPEVNEECRRLDDIRLDCAAP